MNVSIQSSLDLSEFAKAAKKKLQSVRFFFLILRSAMSSPGPLLTKKICFILCQLSNHQFEELAMDVYDEVDRRETDAGESLTNCRTIQCK